MAEDKCELIQPSTADKNDLSTGVNHELRPPQELGIQTDSVNSELGPPQEIGIKTDWPSVFRKISDDEVQRTSAETGVNPESPPPQEVNIQTDWRDLEVQRTHLRLLRKQRLRLQKQKLRKEKHLLLLQKRRLLLQNERLQQQKQMHLLKETLQPMLKQIEPTRKKEMGDELANLEALLHDMRPC